jgi:mRNA interferase RelE/StbE
VSYSVLLLPSAKKSLAKLPRADQAKVDRLIIALAENPRPAGCVKLSGQSHLWRIRSGDYRIVYEIRDQTLIVVVVTIAHRREVYRGL